MLLRVFISVCFSLIGILHVWYQSFACTGIRLIAQDKSVIYARTLEWREDIRSKVLVVPRGMKHVATSEKNKKGMSWINLHAFAGIGIFNYPVIDGVNERGLGVGLFDYRDDIEYHRCDLHDTSHDLAPWELVSYLLGNFSNIAEVIQACKQIKVVSVLMPEIGSVPPLHYIVHDAQGECIVLEHDKHEIKIHDNPLGVITNPPTLDWHLTNLKNYPNVLTMPASYNSPSRFVRAALFTSNALVVQTGKQAVHQAFHLLNPFDIPRGLVRVFRKNSTDNSYWTYTHWTSAADLTRKRYYFRTYDNQRIRMIDLMKTNLNASAIKIISMDGDEDILDVTSLAQEITFTFF